jgi:tRNA dimethylallyltransferase
MQKLADANGVEAVHKLLEEKDPEAADKIHPNNLRRVIRALEVCHLTGKTFTQVNQESRHEPVYDALILGIETEREVLYDRINKRVDEMMKNGLPEEVQNLKNMGISRDTTAMQAIGYKEMLEFLEGRDSLEEAIEKIKMESRRYAKRQLTWFRRNNKIQWVSTSNPEYMTVVLEKCRNFL